MPLPKFNRPALPYTPEKLPFYNRYSSLGKMPPSADQLDGDFNGLMDVLNILGTAINNTAAGIFPGADNPINANRLPTTDGNGNISWTLINALNLDVNAVQTQHIQDAAITMPKIQVQAVGTNQLADGAVTFVKIADGAVAAPKIANGAVQLPKMRSTGHSCFIIGDDADYAYKELPVAANYYVPTRIANATLPSMQPISVVWNNNADNLCSGIKIQDNTTPLSKMVASGNKCLVMGSTGSNVYTEKVADNQSQPWYVFCNNPNAASIALNSLVDIWNNTPFTFSGSKLTDNSVNGTALTNNSVPVAKIQNSSQVAPFAMGFIAANGSIQKSLNILSVVKSGTGYYVIRFNTAANDTKYIVTFGNEDNGGNYVTNCFVVGGSRTTASFNVQVWGSGIAAQDEGFNFVVYAF